MEDPNPNIETLNDNLPSQDPSENYGQPSPQGDGRKVFVGNLSPSIDKENLGKHFEKYGKIEEIDMRGRFAFINFSDPQSASEAVKEMNNGFVGEQQIVCQHHQPSTRYRRPGFTGGRRDPYGGFNKRGRTQHRVIVRSLDPRCTWQNLKDFGRTAGDVNFANVYSYEGKKIGVIEFNNPESQSSALSELPNRLLNDRYVQVEEDLGQFDHLTQPRKRDRSPHMTNENYRVDHRPREDYRYRPLNEPPRSYHNYQRYPSPTFHDKNRVVGTPGRHHVSTPENGRTARSPHHFYDHEHRINEHPRVTERPLYEETGRYRSKEARHPSNTHHQHYYHGESPPTNTIRPPSHTHNNVENYRQRDLYSRGRRYYSSSIDSPKRHPNENYYNDRNMMVESSRYNERGTANLTKSRNSRDKYSPEDRYEYDQTYSRGPRDEPRRHEMPSDRFRYEDYNNYSSARTKAPIMIKEPSRGHYRRDRSRSPEINDQRMRYNARIAR